MFQNKSSTVNDIQEKLIGWWKHGGRDFPWRHSKDPYIILIAELMLHRTIASQVELIYRNFIYKYPRVEDLLTSQAGEVRSILKPLGLNWRIESIIELIKELKVVCHGKIPISKQKLISLPGVGDYVASAIRCFAYGFPEIVVDTNTSRVISRLMGIQETGEMRRNKEVRETYRELLDKEKPDKFNYALLDLGALICRPSGKKCNVCPIRKWCSTGNLKVVKLEKSS
ncbi:MAG: DNA glycosylase [Thermoplasmatales archaeon]